MDIHKTRKCRFIHTSLVVFLLGSFTCLTGSVSMYLGGVLASLCAAFFFGIGYSIFYHYQKKILSGFKTGASAPDTRNVRISDDRIDSLTGLANENGLMAWFMEKAERVSADGKAILILAADLDNFTQVEKTYGKDTADQVLIEIAGRISQFTGEDGIAARTTEEGFAAIATIIPSSAETISAKQAGKLAEMIQRPVELSKNVIWIGGFVGAATGLVTEAPEVLKNARKALKQAKLQGRGHYKVYDAGNEVL